MEGKTMEKENLLSLFKIVREAKNHPAQQIETIATALAKSKHISPIDACKCTCNCKEDQ